MICLASVKSQLRLSQLQVDFTFAVSITVNPDITETSVPCSILYCRICCSNDIKRCRSVCTGEYISAGVGHSLSRTPQKIYSRKDHASFTAPRQSAYEHACSVHSNATNDHFLSRSSSSDLTLRPNLCLTENKSLASMVS